MIEGASFSPRDSNGTSTNRRRRFLVAALVLVGGLCGTAMVVTAQDVQISTVSVGPDQPVTGEPVSIDTTISNLASSNGSVDVTDVYVRTSGELEEHARLEDLGTIESGGTLTIPVSATFDDPGEKRLTVRVVTRDEDGNSERLEYPLYLEVEEPIVRADLSTTTANRSDWMSVSLSNYGNTNLTSVRITATRDGEVLDRGHTFDVAPGTSESARLDTAGGSGDPVNFTATYRAIGEERSTSHVTEIGESSGVQGSIRLTRTQAAPGPNGLTIDGEAANVGSSDVGSVMLRVPEPTGDGHVAEYFVGPVEGSEFATFEFATDLDANRSTVPVEISYNVDGERLTRTQEVQVGTSQAGAPSGPSNGMQPGAQPGSGGFAGGPNAGGVGPGGPGGSGGLPLVPIGLVAVVLAGGFLTYKWHDQ